MDYDWNRLAQRVRQRRDDLDITQAELAALAGVSVMTVRNMENGRAFRRIPPSFPLISLALGWEPTGWRDVAEGREPTLRRQSADVPSDNQDQASAHANATSTADPNPELPLAVRVAIETGQMLDYDVIHFDVDGEPMSVIALAQTGVYDTEEKRAALKEQLEIFSRIKGHIRGEVQDSGERSNRDND